MNKLFLAFAVLSVVLLISCYDNSVGPLGIIPGSRNYSWTHDTLKQQGTYGNLYKIWGSSENDVWACGSDGIFHYDGKSWQEYNGMRWNLDCIYGSSKNDVWTFASGNYNGANIWHYDGSSWKDLGLYSFTNVNGFLGISDITGSAANDIYAVGIFMFGKGGGGRKAVIVHYNGIKWGFFNSGDLKTNMFKICYDGLKKKYYILGEEEKWDTTGSIPNNTENTNKIYEFDGQNLKEIYSSKDVYITPVEVNGKVFFVSENKLLMYSNNSFQVVEDFSNFPYTVEYICGRSEKDLFIYSFKKSGSVWPRYITHYNGTDMQPLYESKDIHAYGLVGNDIFIISTNNSGQCVISRGKLQK